MPRTVNANLIFSLNRKSPNHQTKKSRPGHSDSDFFHTARRGRGRASVIASAAVVTNCFFFADFCLIGRRRSVLGLVLVDENFFLTTLIVARSIRITPSSSS